MTESLTNMTVDGLPAVGVLAKLVGKCLALADAVTEKWVTAEVVYTNVSACGVPYRIVCTTTEDGRGFALNLADAIEALVDSIPGILAALGVN
ncbi:MAG: hypothetical protein DRI39_01855 [Chloroflexi bacterium]|nr:MAG: hypothetical protein DRI39_01855 [Chloroflexota bacterium]RLC95606.1 MAG: hypothetical protein DRI40_05495 [Chloroflexota bacterium]